MAATQGLLLVLFIVTPLISCHDIVVGLARDDDDLLAEAFVKKATQLDGVNFKQVILTNDTTEEMFCDQLLTQGAKPDILIDTTSRPSILGQRKTSAIVKTVARSYGVPTVSTTPSGGVIEASWSGLTESEHEWLLSVMPPSDVIIRVVKDTIVEQDLKDAIILYDDTFEIETKYNSFFDPLETNYKTRKIQKKEISKSGIEEMLKGSKNVTNFFVLGTIETINGILSAAQKGNLLSPDKKWFLVTKSRGKITCKDCHNAQVTLMHPLKLSKDEFNASIILTDTNFENRLDAYFLHDLARAVIDTIHDLKKKNFWPQLSFPKCGHNLTQEQEEQREQLKLGNELASDGLFGRFGRFKFETYDSGSSFQDVTLKVDQVTLFNDRSDDYHRVADWKYDHDGGIFLSRAFMEGDDYGTGQPQGEVIGETKPGKKMLKIVVITQPPFIMKRMIKDKDGKSVPEFYGYCIDMMREIRDKMRNATGANHWDFEYFYEEIWDGRFGENVNGSWTGIIGELSQRRADIGLGPTAVMAERELVVDFTVPYYDLVGINILMKKPAVPSHLFKFLAVLNNQVWLSVFLGFIFMSIMIFIYDRISPYSYHNCKDGWGDLQRRDFSLKEALWFCMTSLTPQGGGEAPQNFSGRLLAGTWWSFGFIVIAAYTANLAAFLTVSRLDSPIESLDHLSDQYRIRYAPQARTQSEVYFQRMSFIEHKFYQIWINMSLNPLTPPEERAKYSAWDYPISDRYTKMLAQMYQAKMPTTYEEGVRRTRESRSAQEGFAFIADATLIKYAILRHCELHSIGNEFSRKPIALVVQQNSTLKDKLSSAILKLLNERKLEQLKEDWWKVFRRTCEDTKKSNDGISIHNIGGVFIVIFSGVVLACITLAFEYIMLRRKRARVRRERNAVQVRVQPPAYAGPRKGYPN